MGYAMYGIEYFSDYKIGRFDFFSLFIPVLKVQ